MIKMSLFVLCSLVVCQSTQTMNSDITKKALAYTTAGALSYFVLKHAYSWGKKWWELRPFKQKLAQDGLALHVACQLGNLEEVKGLIAAGADINLAIDENSKSVCTTVNGLTKRIPVISFDKKGITPLYTAAFKGYTKIVAYLLQQGADATIANTQGRTALHIAAYNGYKEIVELLLNQGIAVDSKDCDGRTPLLYASSQGHKELVSFLIQRGAHVRAQNNNRFTALHIASSRGHKDVIELLLDKSALIDAQDETNWTPLHHASAKGHKEAVLSLIQRGASVTAQTVTEWTALHLASSNGHQEVVDLLINNGACIDDKDRTGKTSLHEAARAGQLEAEKTLICNSFFAPCLSLSVPSTGTPLQEQCLITVLKHLDDFDETSFNNEIVPMLADKFIFDDNNRAFFVSQAPLNLQQAMMAWWQKNTSEENTKKHNDVLNVHNARHLAKIKEIVAIKNNEDQTAHDAAKKENHADCVALLDHIERTLTFGALNEDLKNAITATMEKRLALPRA